MLLRVLVLCAVTVFTAGPGLSQEGPGYRILDAETPPAGMQAERPDELARKQGLDDQMTYATRITGDLSDDPAAEVFSPKTPDRRTAPQFGSLGVVVVLVVLLTMLAAWLKFAGGGVLLARAPDQGKTAPQAAPAGWNVSDADRLQGPEALLAAILRMADRRAATVKLLHHCLLKAGDETQTRFARADTEREAFRRLNSAWRQHGPLRDLLRQAELAHYGGREVTEADFAQLVDIGRSILLGRGASHA